MQCCEMVAADNVPEVVALQRARIEIVERRTHLGQPQRIAVEHFEIEIVVDDLAMELVAERAVRAFGQFLHREALGPTLRDGGGNAGIIEAGQAGARREAFVDILAEAGGAHRERARVGLHHVIDEFPEGGPEFRIGVAIACREIDRRN